MGHKFGYFDLAAPATDRLISTARKPADPLRVALSMLCRSTMQLHRGDYEIGMSTVNDALRVVDAETDEAALSVAVQLHLRQAIFAARAGAGDDADAHVDEARSIVGYPPPLTTTSTPPSTMWTCTRLLFQSRCTTGPPPSHGQRRSDGTP